MLSMIVDATLAKISPAPFSTKFHNIRKIVVQIYFKELIPYYTKSMTINTNCGPSCAINIFPL